MNPPTEQLIRDYLNRVSVAARRRLGDRERQELLDRTRARIEASVGGMSGATALKVRRVLADLGDPIGLAEREAARHADGAGGEPAAARPAPPAGAPPAGAAPPASAAGHANGTAPTNGTGHVSAADHSVPVIHVVPVPEPAPGGGAAGSAVRVPAARRGGSSGHAGSARPGRRSGPPVPFVSVPVAQAVPGGGAAAAPIAASIQVRGNPAVSPGTRVDAVPVPAAASAPGEVPPPATAGSSSGSGSASNSGSGSSEGPAAPTSTGTGPVVPGLSGLPRPREVPPLERIGDGAPGSAPEPPGEDEGPVSTGAIVAVPRADGAALEMPADDVIYEAELAYRPADLARQARDMAGRGLVATARVLARQAWRIGASLLALAMRDKLETLAILLLGLGGAVYPPLWVIGAILAVVSPKWDGRDKLLGLALPVVLVVFGAVMVVALGGERATMAQYGLEGWLAAGRLARVAAVIGAGYLLRRVYRGRRPAKPPPWSRPRGRQ